jgi:hypothetical protein
MTIEIIIGIIIGIILSFTGYVAGLNQGANDMRKRMQPKYTPIITSGFANVYCLDDNPLDDQERYDVILAKAKARLECIERNKEKIMTGKSVAFFTETNGDKENDLANER